MRYVFQFEGAGHGTRKFTNFTLENTVPFLNGSNNVSLLSVMVGLPVCYIHDALSLSNFTIPNLNYHKEKKMNY